ncbi:hypothetical protein VNO78_04145 [Psophocarpus tetragonolobus]|uniref:Uncharacterized protein n=1 Tax=Psophocarpus tetragonolobus TaxID=3891 RepID=A0AAN9T1J9_PSOTE
MLLCTTIFFNLNSKYAVCVRSRSLFSFIHYHFPSQSASSIPQFQDSYSAKLHPLFSASIYSFSLAALVIIAAADPPRLVFSADS